MLRDCFYCDSTKNSSLMLNYCTLHVPRCPCVVWGYWVWVSGRPTLLSLTAFRTRSSLQVWTNWSGLKSVRKHFPKDAAWWTKHGTTVLYFDTRSALYTYAVYILKLTPAQFTQWSQIKLERYLLHLTLSRDFWVLESYSWPAASTHCRTASASMLCSLISLRYSSAFWLDFCTHKEIKTQ